MLYTIHCKILKRSPYIQIELVQNIFHLLFCSQILFKLSWYSIVRIEDERLFDLHFFVSYSRMNWNFLILSYRIIYYNVGIRNIFLVRRVSRTAYRLKILNFLILNYIFFLWKPLNKYTESGAAHTRTFFPTFPLAQQKAICLFCFF